MQSKRSTQNRSTAGSRRVVSIDLTDEQVVDLDARLIEAMERIERVRSKAMMAVGSMLASSP